MSVRWVILVLSSVWILSGCGDDKGSATTSPDTASADTSAVADTLQDTEGATDAVADTDTADAFVDEREACADNNPLRNVYFGDLHVHTSLSFDAYVFDVRNDPAAAYRFARGESIPLPPLDEMGEGTQQIQLDRPLDFAAITDHSEYFAEVQGCLDPDSGAYESRTCKTFRQGGADSIYFFGLTLTFQPPRRIRDVCTPDALDCTGEAKVVWRRVQDAAEQAYDRTSSCSFTSFVAYEYSNATNISNMHRNVLFRNATVPEAPTSFFEAATPSDLWAALERDCLDTDSPCDVLAIPHNSNWSNGNLFEVEYPGATTPEEERAQAERRAKLEPLVEIYQHKGDSECMNGLGTLFGAPDEFCDFEKLRQAPFEDCGEGTGSGAMSGRGCLSRLDFVRGVFQEGLREERRVGANPFKLGIIASTDTHNGTPGAVDERNYLGHWGNNEDTSDKRLTLGGVTPGGVIFSGGGLAAVWAEENSREAIFDAMRRRETYGTSGPRMAVRLFAGWSYPDTLCGDPDAIATGYADGVPMGGTLSQAPADTAPTFFVSALRDPGSAQNPGTPLQRVQIIKGWVDAAGDTHEKIFEVAGDPESGASVDVNTCETSGEGFDSLCSVWTDPEFDPTLHSFYYARVLENPTCRWSNWQCISYAESERPEICDDPIAPKTTSERAWTSPIWYTP